MLRHIANNLTEWISSEMSGPNWLAFSSLLLLILIMFSGIAWLTFLSLRDGVRAYIRDAAHGPASASVSSLTSTSIKPPPTPSYPHEGD